MSTLFRFRVLSFSQFLNLFGPLASRKKPSHLSRSLESKSLTSSLRTDFPVTPPILWNLGEPSFFQFPHALAARDSPPQDFSLLPGFIAARLSPFGLRRFISFRVGPLFGSRGLLPFHVEARSRRPARLYPVFVAPVLSPSGYDGERDRKGSLFSFSPFLNIIRSVRLLPQFQDLFQNFPIPFFLVSKAVN